MSATLGHQLVSEAQAHHQKLYGCLPDRIYASPEAIALIHSWLMMQFTLTEHLTDAKLLKHVGSPIKHDPNLPGITLATFKPI